MSKIFAKINKIDYAKEFGETIVLQSPPTKEWHPKYEWAGVWARKFIKQYTMILVMYGIYGAILSYVYLTAGYSGLAISGILMLLYTINRLGSRKEY